MRLHVIPALFAALAGACLALAACSSSVPAVPSGPRLSVDITNDTSERICHVRVSHCDLHPPMAFDVLPKGERLSPGATFSASMSGGCWNVLAENCDHRMVTRLPEVMLDTNGSALHLTPSVPAP